MPWDLNIIGTSTVLCRIELRLRLLATWATPVVGQTLMMADGRRKMEEGRWKKEDVVILPITNEKVEIFFVGNGVAKALGYDQADKAVLRNVDEDDRTKHTVIDRKGRTQSLMSSMRAAPCCVTLQVHVDEENKTSYLIQVSGYIDKTTVAIRDGGSKYKSTTLIQGTGE